MQASAGYPPSGTVPTCFVRSAIRHVQREGHNCDRLLRKFGLDASVVDNDEARVPLEAYLDLMSAVARALNDEFLGYGAAPVKLGTWQMACLSSVHPGSIGHAIGRMCRFYRLIECGLRAQLVIEGDEAVIEFVRCKTGPELDLYAYERVMGAARCFLTWLMKGPFTLRGVALPHQRPAHAAEHRWLFLGAEVAYGCPRASLRFDRAILDAPIQRDECELDQLLMNPIDQLLIAVSTESAWASRIRELVSRELPWLPEFEDIAARLSIHPQALRRRLAQEGLSFNDIKNQVRYNIAEYYLSKQALSVEEVAFRSGFSEASSFIRAFRRWAGTTPAAYAQLQRSRVAPSRVAH